MDCLNVKFPLCAVVSPNNVTLEEKFRKAPGIICRGSMAMAIELNICGRDNILYQSIFFPALFETDWD